MSEYNRFRDLYDFSDPLNEDSICSKVSRHRVQREGIPIIQEMRSKLTHTDLNNDALVKGLLCSNYFLKTTDKHLSSDIIDSVNLIKHLKKPTTGHTIQNTKHLPSGAVPLNVMLPIINHGGK